MNDRIKNILREKHQVFLENKQAFNDLGVFNLRLTMGSVWNKIPDITKKLVLTNKEERPDLYELEYYGFEYNDSDPSIYVLRNYRKYIKEFNVEDFYDKKLKQYKFDLYSIGIDYANGSQDHTVFLLSGYKLNNVGNYDKYIIEEKIEIPEERINLLTTTENFGQWIIDCFDKFDGFENSTFHYDINGHDFMQTLQTELYEYIGYKIKMFKAIKHKSTLNKDAGLNNRVTWMRNLLSKNKVYGNLESLPYLDQCLSELKFGDNNTNIPNPKIYQDPYDALFYGSYPYRFKMGI